jgi:hypothetical protein
MVKNNHQLPAGMANDSRRAMLPTDAELRLTPYQELAIVIRAFDPKLSRCAVFMA